ncbi:hypothetical protein [Parahaliea mediterranea]|uniref:hypothetical protein n=1 Tax=Parahaliea mediterranea TaxID=651086 RepID=UPI000C0B97D0|nr:hypothetical protein [Parahaliea mediterranea]MAC35357.1 hypothetical protein [Haliea sp.]|tara:strand:- start:8374 stop:8706 length:333 start_codon:yes stop_codon:yes gene_type:complete
MTGFRRVLTHPLAKALAWVTLILGIAMGVNLAGITVLGNLSGWSQWLDAHASHFLIWRLGLYSLTIYGWLRMRRRLYRDAENRAARQRLVRAEIGAVAAITLLEASVLLT